MREFLLLMLGVLSCSAAPAQTGVPVRVELSLAGGKATYRIGEPILLDLKFTATEPDFSLNVTTTEPASPVDTLFLSPTTGVFPWLDDQARGSRYSPDYEAVITLERDEPRTISLPLNALYRFDAPGYYKVHVATNRVSGVAGLTSNEVTFHVEPMSDDEDAARAAALENEIREARDMRHAQALADELDWLSGDGSTRVKLSLFLHPKEFYPFGVNVTRGLWIARNRGLVVAELERALGDPAQPLSAGSSLLQTAVSLRARVEVPFDPAAPNKALPAEQIEGDYLKRIAATLPQRTGEPLVTAALTLLTRLAQRKENAGPDFANAREVLITHFAEVNEYNVDWLLNSYGSYLMDTRIVPALENILQTQWKPVMTGERAAALRQLIKLTPEDIRPFVVKEVCASHPVMLDVIQDVSLDSLPEADKCLQAQIHAAAANLERRRFDLQQRTAFAARFATQAIYDDLLALYEKSAADWDGQARGGLLAYFVRWDAQHALPLLEAALPLNAEHFDPNVSFGLFKPYHSNGLEAFLRQRLAVGPPAQALEAAFHLSQHGPAEDQEILRRRLDRWRTVWSGEEIPLVEGQLEAELVQAIIRGKEWQAPDTEAAALREGCISAVCRSRFQARQ